MHKKALFSVLFLILCISVSAQEGADIESMVQDNNQFALDLFGKLTQKEGNIFISPLSISTAFAMVYSGARGETADEIAEVMNFNLTDGNLHKSFSEYISFLNVLKEKDVNRFDLNNSFWFEKTYAILDEYKDLLSEYYDSEVKSVNFKTNPDQAQNVINKWASEKTENLIPKLLDVPLLPTAKWLLVNTIYFKGVWQNIFNEEDNSEAMFHESSEVSYPVQMMHLNTSVKYSWCDGYEIAELPYSGEDLSMVIILPDRNPGIESVADKLDEIINTDIYNLQYTDLHIYLPKFGISYGIKEMIDCLKDLGIKKAFSGEADFSGIDGRKNFLYIDKVEHKAVIKVDEQGTEAAAATAVGCFPAGTLVHTPDGLRPIEEISSGDRVLSFNFNSYTWETDTVSSGQSYNYAGDMITISYGNEQLVSTGTQIFYVKAGADLSARPDPRENPGINSGMTEGRWVQARDLLPGDVLQTISGGTVSVAAVNSVQDKNEVWFLEIDRNANCAVNYSGILVHNGDGAMKKSAPLMFTADHPFLFLIKENVHNGIIFMGRVVNPFDDAG